MKKENFFLTTKCGWFYSYTDEDQFFDWIKKIPSITHVKGIGTNLLLYFKSKRIKAQDLRELIALFRRYKIDMSELKIFLNEGNKEWFYEKSKHAYWHKKVFGVVKKNSDLIDKK
jgi:hypothetical protein